MSDPLKIVFQSEEDPNHPKSTKETVRYLKREMQDFLELNTLIAKIKNDAFNKYILEGFTEEQALFLIK